MDKFVTIVWRVIELLFQVILILVLAAILLGQEAGSAVNSVLANATAFLAALPASTVAVVLIVAALLWWKRRA
ncbi:MAG: hypothetical protein KDJ46_09775 [Rhodobiaceae bacterium]|nr:hypothetical protein [Rhodobiaceae bacterium]